ncbi:hypothetical protein jhhlp_001977 [Lomentospora prolificans]|uniref:Erythromycin esterase n=1 Tax=Lomentospora prolificans TaxID=41688 RepID=A0A2N3NCU3_9PEZI|nr:hypothetical protein jhhlp_001977 [Lomentospora prolificans]
MSPPRRRSARLAAGTPAKTPKKAPTPSLDTVAESSELAQDVASTKKLPRPAIVEVPSTPSSSSPIKPPMSEMHPSKVHTTMAAPSSGLRLGFTDIKPSEKKGSNQPSGLTQVTPSKGPALPSSPFTFTFTRQGTAADLGLSSRAQEMMNELREEAAKIKAELAAQREREEQEDEMNGGRRIAKPKGKSGRFSAAHMAEFKKMDSIENHPSAFRALRNQLTPVAGIKRSSSRANLDEAVSPITQRSGIKRTQSKARLNEPDTPRHRKPVTASSPIKSRIPVDNNPPTPAKRFKQRLEDDASSSRPVSRDGSSIPRPKSSGVDAAGGNLVRSQSTMSLVSPSKTALARSAIKGPTITLVKSPSKPELSSLKRSTTTNALLPGSATPTRRILSPGRFEKVKSILRGHKGQREKAGSALPLPANASKTPNPPRVDKALPPVPVCATSPRRKLSKRLGASPTGKEMVKLQNSPSPLPSSNIFKFRAKSSQSSRAEQPRFASVDAVMAGAGKTDGEVLYPDLSKFGSVSPPPVNSDGKAGSMPPPSVPATFTFRSDHTISFKSASPTGFGGCAGQSSVRHVRPSILPIPGSFPNSIMDATKSPTAGGPNKENKSPVKLLPGISHGMNNKKRHRVSSDEEDAEREAAERAAKRKKNEHVPEGDALLAPRLVGKTPTGFKKAQVSGLGSQPLARDLPVKRKPGLSLSRLKMLSQPKNRM